MRHIPNNREYLHALSLLTLNSANSDSAVPYVGSLSQQERGVFLGLANRNHVVIRALQSLHQSATAAGQAELVDWTTDVLTAERARISTARSEERRVGKEGVSRWVAYHDEQSKQKS